MRLPESAAVSRRAVSAAVLAAVSAAPQVCVLPASAGSSRCIPTRPLEALRTLERVDVLLAKPSSWSEAAELLEAPPLGTGLAAVLDACTEQPGLKDNLMNNAAFLVYYEEARYKDTRLEPQEPGLRARQNGARREAIAAIDDLRSELQFLLKGPSSAADAEDLADLSRYSATGRRALEQYVSLLGPPPG